VPTMLLCGLVLVSCTVRPQMFGYLFLVVLLILLELYRQGREKAIWLLPPLFLFWVNTHGSWIIGMGVLIVHLCSGLYSFRLGSVEAVAWTATQRIKLEIALLLSLAVLPFTPYGTELAAFPFDMAFGQPVGVHNVLEWRSMPFEESGAKLFLIAIVLMLVLQLLFHFRWRVEELALAIGGAAMACLHVRFLMLFVPFFLPLFATMLARWVPAYERLKDKYAANAFIMALVVGAMLYFAPSRDFLQEKVDQRFPVSAVRYLDSHNVPGPMLNSYGFGGYLIGTGHKVFMDGRSEVYERAGVFSDYLDLTGMKPAAFSVLERYHIASCLLERDEPLSTILSSSSGWKRIYVDGTSAIFVRKELNGDSMAGPSLSDAGGKK
jgi:hypothetical protein